MKKKLQKLLIAVAAILLGVIFVNTNQAPNTVAKAGCPNCMCVNAPDCLPVVVTRKGLPFVWRNNLQNDEYVREPYKTEYATSTNYAVMVADFIIGSGAILFSAVAITKVKHAYHRH